MLAIRFGGQSILLLLAIRLLGRPLLPVKGERVAVAIAGTIGYGSESAFYFTGLNHGSAAAVTLLFYLYPVWVMLATIALDRKAPPRSLFVALFLALAGSALVVLGGGDAQIEPLGIVLALCTSFAYTGYLIGTDRNVKRTDPLTAAAWLGIGASLANLVYAFAFDAVVLPSASSWWRIVGHGRVLGRRVRRDAAGAPAGGCGAQRDHRRHGAAHRRGARVLLPRRVRHDPRSSSAVLLILGGAVLAMLIRTTKTAEPPI